MTQQSSTHHPLTRRLGMAGALVLVVLIGVLGRRWQATVRVAALRVVGAEHAAPGALRTLTRVDTGAVLYDVEPALVADRVRRHPWVEDASVMRLPTGTLRIDVEERTPAALAMTSDGTPAFYVDRQGFCMPLPDSASYDVPLLYGIADLYTPTQPVAHGPVRRVLAALAASKARDLVAELVAQPDSSIRLHTRPTDRRDAIPVRLGHDRFSQRLDYLLTFWAQAVRPRPDTHFSLIDLRFDSQIVTKEERSAVSLRRSATESNEP